MWNPNYHRLYARAWKAGFSLWNKKGREVDAVVLNSLWVQWWNRVGELRYPEEAMTPENLGREAAPTPDAS